MFFGKGIELYLHFFFGNANKMRRENKVVVKRDSHYFLLFAILIVTFLGTFIKVENRNVFIKPN